MPHAILPEHVHAMIPVPQEIAILEFRNQDKGHSPSNCETEGLALRHRNDHFRCPIASGKTGFFVTASRSPLYLSSISRISAPRSGFASDSAAVLEVFTISRSLSSVVFSRMEFPFRKLKASASPMKPRRARLVLAF